MDLLGAMEGVRWNQLPGAEDIDFVRPNCSYVVERQRQIQEKKGYMPHWFGGPFRLKRKRRQTRDVTNSTEARLWERT
jgi:hypothetical protein